MRMTRNMQMPATQSADRSNVVPRTSLPVNIFVASVSLRTATLSPNKSSPMLAPARFLTRMLLWRRDCAFWLKTNYLAALSKFNTDCWYLSCLFRPPTLESLRSRVPLVPQSSYTATCPGRWPLESFPTYSTYVLVRC